MKKRLLFALMAMCVAVSGFALSQGEFVYTPQGRFQIIGDNINGNSALTDLTGWTVISASAEKTLADNFIVNANGYADGMNSVASIDATTTEGMYFKFEPTSASDTYVVSFKMKGAALMTTRTYTIAWDGAGAEVGDQLTNCVKVKGNSEHKYQQEDGLADEVIVNDGGEELTEEWQTFNYAIVGDGTSRTYFIELRGLAAEFQFADLQIAPAIQYADLRQRDAMLNKLKAYRDCNDWPADIWSKYDGYPEVITSLEAIGDESSQTELDELLATAKEILDEFLVENMDDYLEGNDANYFTRYTGEKNQNKLNQIGDWVAIPAGRAHWNVNEYPDMGHYQNSSSWCYSNVDNPMGATLQRKLLTGSYVFYIESTAAVREAFKQTWNIDRGMKPAYGVAYLAKKVDGVVTDTIAKVVQDLDPVIFTPFIVSAKVEEEGMYEFGILGYCKDEYKDLKLGSVVILKDAAIWGVNTSPYTLKQLNYEDDVREQITTGRDNLTTATTNIGDASYFWGKPALQAVVDEVTPRIEKYEAMSQEEIINTFVEDVYVKSERTSNPETGLLVYEVYDTATKLIIAGNREFVAKNDTLNSIQKVIDNAETVLYMRVYDTATGKEALKAAINKAKDIQAQMKSVDYSEENVAIIVAANKELNEAVEAFKATLPAESVVTLVDIDFEKDAELDFDTFLYTITGAKGSMLFSAFITNTAEGDCSFEKGFWSNGEHLWPGYIRVGNGDGTVTFNPIPEGAADMGTNILRFSFDYYIQGLTKAYLGFFLKGLVKKDIEGVETEEDSEFAGFYLDAYNNTFQTNTFNIDLDYVARVAGATYNNVSPVDAENPTTNTLPKTSFEVILDYGANQMYCSTTIASGSATTAPIQMEGIIPTSFILRSNYTVDSRRAWFDNLKIELVKAGAYDPTAIATVKAVKTIGDAIYNLAGQKVGKDYKGLVIKNGVKMIQK